jgi:ABC-type multidrug transport system ATPase subunit
VIVVKGIKFGFAGKRLIDRFSCQFAAGKLTLFVGPNGSGKSTLMSIAVGLRQANEGEVFLQKDGQRFNAASQEFRHSIAYLGAENNGLFTKLNAYSNLKFWHDLRGSALAQQRIEELLDGWRLRRSMLRSDLPVERFSTGMKKRLAMARMESLSVPYWFLDEPLHGLDQDGIHYFCQVLAKHLDAGGAASIITHDISVFEDFPFQTISSQSFIGKNP